MDLFEPKPYLSLFEFNSLIRSAITYSLPDLYWVVAEIADVRVTQRNHCYLELIEKERETVKAQSRATIWSSAFGLLSTKFEGATGERLKRGMKVLLCVEVGFHEVYGLSLSVRDIDPTYSLGEMARRKGEAIQRLVAEGIMDRNKILALPLVPQRIAIISSPTAAGYGDFLNHLEHNPRGFRFTTTLFAAAMQGAEAVASMTGALERVRMRRDLFDVVVMVRGGGSQADLSSFDAYDLAAEVARFPLPVITGIGHERDDSVVDMVAHRRMKTPTAVAEFLVGRVSAFAERLAEMEKRIARLTEGAVRERRYELVGIAQRVSQGLRRLLLAVQYGLMNRERDLHEALKHSLIIHRRRLDGTVVSLRYPPERLLAGASEKLAGLRNTLRGQVTHELRHQGSRIERIEQAVRLLDPENVLRRGFSITYVEGKALRDARLVEAGLLIRTRLHRGELTSRVEGRDEEGDEGDLHPGDYGT
ncbi:MAG TPA: exodeoxyribonuclease VII large subunit [Dissulfurispiraceae bacterium]|nr:exodeoxyribonuclease VII large subunit [Dissulfurispiraceae bacterium]